MEPATLQIVGHSVGVEASERGLKGMSLSPNNPLQRSVNDKVHGRGRDTWLLDQVTSARVLERTRPAAERGR